MSQAMAMTLQGTMEKAAKGAEKGIREKDARGVADYTAALDAVIKSAITSAVVHGDCGSMNRILHAMEDAGETMAAINRTCTEIVEYAHNNLMLPQGTLVYLPIRKGAPGRFGCRAAAARAFLVEMAEDWITAWKEAHPDQPTPPAPPAPRELWKVRLANTPTFSVWQRAKKKAKAKAKASDQNQLAQACKRVLSILDRESFIDASDEKTEAIRQAILSYLN